MMVAENRSMPKALTIVLLAYGLASLIHFVHNAEFLADYPSLPASWTRVGVYFAWVGMTVVGTGGWLLVSRGYQLAGLLLLAVYAALGLDSLGHYVVAPPSSHTLAMNATILLEVGTAALVFVTVSRQLARRAFSRESPHNGV